ncbi:MAG: RimK family alpha-L-glutamate ligase [Micavibrio aeruginosavorus]|uniref:RimK family alpha-L-glutamate ligase n=1 Tax=Micavibrio aeruginosavorus TaxID=349221 RepID=A0A2W5MYE9_9BACT|nr:MAG: RimK family alpha-L-glutamate ligase [Micavibrio aeruginosavorus]
MPSDVPTLNGNREYRYKYVIVSDRPLDLDYDDPQTLFVTAADFIANKSHLDFRKLTGAKIINLCSSYDYLSKGYYSSLMAEARRLRCVPSVADMISLNWKRHYQIALPELNALVDKHFRAPSGEPTSYKYIVYFGRVRDRSLEALGRKLFDLFRFPMITVEIKQDAKGRWTVDSVEPVTINDLPKDKQETFVEYLKEFAGTAWRSFSAKRTRHWIGILVDPLEKNPPSNKSAIAKFFKAGKDLNVSIEAINKSDYAALVEYDALLIRETTAINHHTYRFAAKAESEGIPCIDDTQSMIRCCNKVFQYELLESKKIPLPRTVIVDRKSEKILAEEMNYPAVVKIPDGAFSRGVMKVENPREFHVAAGELLKKSDVILAQEFVSSGYDWRIGILDDEPLFAVKYYMAEGHWQIYNHNAKTLKRREGKHETVRLNEVPHEVMLTALKATKLIGNGLYGVDLKVSNGKIIVMEVNDNPSIDAGIEDAVGGEKIYQAIISSLLRRIEAVGMPAPPSLFSDKEDALIRRPYQPRVAGARE